MRVVCSTALVCCLLLAPTAVGQVPKGWPAGVEAVEVARGDGEALQPALWWASAAAREDDAEPVPLVVALHTWSGDWRQTDPGAKAARACIERGWAFVHPDFGGPNRTPAACGSARMVHDVLDAVAFVQAKACIDPEAIFLFGGSGGGHAALLMAARSPERWAGVSAWVPIVDLAQWHRECRERPRFGKYADDLEKVCGGAPGSEVEVDGEYARRSPLPILARARELRIDLHAGVRDGHEGSVPIRHVLQAFDALASEEQRVGEELRERLTAAGAVPEELVDTELSADGYGTKRPLWRRTSGNARVTLFDGGHEILVDVAFAWFDELAGESR